MTKIHVPSSFVGFDRIFDQLDRFQHSGSQPSYPPHNLIRVDHDKYVLELAVAGYSEKDLEVVQEKGVLTIRTHDGYDPTFSEDGVDFLHKGISAKRFRKSFTLSDNIEVSEVDLVNGMLRIHLHEHIPEQERPKYFNIGFKNDQLKLLTE